MSTWANKSHLAGAVNFAFPKEAMDGWKDEVMAGRKQEDFETVECRRPGHPHSWVRMARRCPVMLSLLRAGRRVPLQFFRNDRPSGCSGMARAALKGIVNNFRELQGRAVCQVVQAAALQHETLELLQEDSLDQLVPHPYATQLDWGELGAGEHDLHDVSDAAQRLAVRVLLAGEAWFGAANEETQSRIASP